jgi:hypothetical protein
VIFSALLGYVGIIASRARASALRSEVSSDAAREQLQNNHKENLRDDLDGKHDATLEALAEFRLEYQQDQLAVFAELRALASDDTGQRRRITDLENTQSQAPSIFEPPRKGKHS